VIAVRSILAILSGNSLFAVGVKALLDSRYIVATLIPVIANRHPDGRSKWKLPAMIPETSASAGSVDNGLMRA
jgi:hypothetical protein